MYEHNPVEGGGDAKWLSHEVHNNSEVNPSIRADDPTELEPPPQLPVAHRSYFCCRNCRRILAEPQWYREGCMDCNTGPVPRGELLEYATSHFHNFFGLIAPEKSWVARLIGKKDCPNGVFAEAISDEDLGVENEDAEMDNISDEEHEGNFPSSRAVHAPREESLADSELYDATELQYG